MPRDSNERPGDRIHRSPGFSLIIDHLRTEQKQHVLDLGEAVTANIEFLSELQCKVYVEHLSTMLGALNAQPSGDSSPTCGAVDEILAYAKDVQFDVILAWDLLNYLPPAALESVVGRLARFCKRGTLLFALICMGKQIPDAPTGFKIAAEGRLMYETAAEKQRRCPQYNSPVLLKKLAGFSVVRSYLLQNNIQEYVFRFQ